MSPEIKQLLIALAAFLLPMGAMAIFIWFINRHVKTESEIYKELLKTNTDHLQWVVEHEDPED